MTAEKLRDIYAAIGGSTSDRLEEMLSALPPRARGHLLQIQSELRTRALEQVEAKLQTWSMLPWKLLTMWNGEVTGGQWPSHGEWPTSAWRSTTQPWKVVVAPWCTEWLTTCLQEPHCFENRLTSGGRSVPDLKQCPELYIELQTYALSVLVERKVEAQHAAIKRLGVVAGTACSVAGICSKLRGPENLRLLDTCPRFKACCVDMWATKNLVRQTLRHVGIDPTRLVRRRSLTACVPMQRAGSIPGHDSSGGVAYPVEA